MGKPTAQSLLKKLEAATEAGDFEAVRAVSAAMAELLKPKPKPAAAKKASRPKRAAHQQLPPDRSSYLAPSRPKSETFVGRDGEEHPVGRRVSMAHVTFANTFDPKDYGGGLSPKHAKLEKRLLKVTDPTPRPGEPGAMRDPVEKVEVLCERCRRTFNVYPWECERVPGDDEASYYCNGCIKKRGR